LGIVRLEGFSSALLCLVPIVITYWIAVSLDCALISISGSFSG